MGPIGKALKDASVEECGKVRRTESEAGDTMRSCSVGTVGEDSRDAIYVRVCVMVSLALKKLHYSRLQNLGRGQNFLPF